MKKSVAYHISKDQVKPHANGCGYIWDLVGSDYNSQTSVDYCLMDSPSEKHKHHTALEFYCITKGTAVVHVGQQAYRVKPGSVVQIPTGQEHYALPDGELEMYVVSTPPFSKADYIT